MRLGSTVTANRPLLNLARWLLPLALAAIATQPAAAEGLYVGVHGGASWTEDDDVDGNAFRYDTGYGAGLALGYGFGANDVTVRLELEGTYRRNKVREPASGQSDDRLVTIAFLGNAYFDYRVGSKWTPYFGFGTGYVILGGSAPESPIARVGYQLGVGVGYDITESVTATLDYRALYSDVGKNNLETSGGDYLNQSVWLGLRFGF